MLLGAAVLLPWATAGADERDTDRAPAAPEPALVQPPEIIVVTGSRTETPLDEATVATEVITRGQIEASGAQTLAAVLAKHPGLEIIRSFRGSAVRVQGLDPDYVVVLVDGERTLGRIGGAIDLERFPVETIERIEIVKGASSALYGSEAIAGVINIVTRPVSRPLEAEAHLAYGSGGRFDLSGRGAIQRGRADNRVTLGLHQADAVDLDPSDAATTASAYREWSIEDRVSVRLGTLHASLGADYLRRDARGIDLSAAGATFDRRSLTEVGGASARVTWRPRPGRRFEARVRASQFRDQYVLDQRGSDALDRYEDTRERLLEGALQADVLITRRHLVTTGVEALDEGLRSPRLEAAGHRRRLAWFVQDEWVPSFSPLVTLMPGARLDLDTQFGRHLTPKLSARLDPHAAVTVRASVGWGFRAPDFRELLLRFDNPAVGYRIEGNPELRPERSRSANVGVEVRPLEPLWLSANAFYNDIDDLIIPTLVPQDPDGASPMTVFQYVNIASAHTRGVETRARLAVGERLDLDVGYTFTATEDHATGRPLPGRAVHRATAGLGARHPAWAMSGQLRASVTGARRFYGAADADGHSAALTAAPHALIAARLARELGDHLTLFAGVDNLFDEGDPTYLPVPPRTLYAGATARY